MLKTSEFVSIGHPDKVADYISSHLLDEYLKRDPSTRYAVEVQIKDNHVTLGGEITSRAFFNPDEITRIVKEAVRTIGYTHSYAERWGKDNAIDADDIKVEQYIGMQSPDIAQGVDRDGWGDQGIFWGMAEKGTDDLMPLDHSTASKLGRMLYQKAKEEEHGWGLDIKTQITMRDSRPIEVIVAIPCLTDADAEKAKAYVRSLFPFDHADIIVNGTGRYVRHSSWGDCGTTGRKLAVDFYGGNCFIGGGSPWTKDGSKADVALNILARHYACLYLKSQKDVDKVFCAISSCIGRRDITLAFFDGNLKLLGEERMQFGVSDVASMFSLREPIYSDLCMNGLFTCIR